jgi:hypothetical protein
MKTFALLAILSAVGAQQAKGKGVSPNFGKTPVPFGPKPSGCSAFEILVGPFPIFLIHSSN